MTEGTNNSSSTTRPEPGSAAAQKVATRRAMLKAAALTMPLIMTLRGKPAHAQQASLGSLGIQYGMYVNQADIDSNNWDQSWIGEAKNTKGEVLKDKTRRTTTVADPTKPK